VENLFTAGAAWTILEGTPGSFLSAGANFVVGRVLFGSACGPCGARASEHHYACDFGIMLRPLPIVSFGYAVTNAGLSGFEREGERWPRVSRWGVSYFWEQKVVISYAEERDGEETRRNYGFIVSTALPLELLGGFSDGSASFGVRCAIDRFRAAAAFRSGGGEGTEIMVSLEAVFGLARGGEAQ
jgi:hypothetical protein